MKRVQRVLTFVYPSRSGLRSFRRAARRWACALWIWGFAILPPLLDPPWALALEDAGQDLAVSPARASQGIASTGAGGRQTSAPPRHYGRAQDTGDPAASTQVPVLAAVADHSLEPYQRWTYPLVLENADSVGAEVEFRLETNAPAGLTLDARTGVLSWRPAQNQSPSTNRIVVWATAAAGAGEPLSFILTVAARPLVSWEFRTDGAISTVPAIADDGTVYVLSAGPIAVEGAPASEGVIAAALDPANGAVRWQRKWLRTSTAAPVHAPIVGDDGLLYVLASPEIHAVDLVTGADVWQVGGTNRWTAAPLLGADGRLYLADAGGTVHVLDSASGTPLGQFAVDGVPGLLDRQGVLYAVGGAQVHAFDPGSGARLWTSPAVGTRGGNLALGTDGAVCFSSADSLAYPIRAALVALNPADGSVRWQTAKYPEMQPPVGPVTGADGRIFTGWYDKPVGVSIGRYGPFSMVYCNASGYETFDGLTGTWLPRLRCEVVYYEVPYAGHMGGVQQPLPLGIVNTAPAVTQDGLVLIGSQNNGVGVMNAADSTTASLVWTYSAGTRMSAPAVSKDGMAYFGDDQGVLHAVRLGPASGLATAGWPKALGNARNTGRAPGPTTVNSLEFPLPATQTIPVGGTLSLTLTATNPAASDATFAFKLVSAPTGMTLDPASGELAWTPSADQSFSSNSVLVSVADSSTPPLRRAGRFAVIVGTNAAPTLLAPHDATVRPWHTLYLSVRGTDTDRPAQALTYGLGAGAPEGMAIDALGFLTWTPEPAWAGTTNRVTVQVADPYGGLAQAAIDIRVVETNHARLPGEIVWQFPLLSGSYSSPAVGPDGTIYVCGGYADQKALAVDSATGAQRWEFDTGGYVSGDAVVLGNQGRAYVISHNERLYAMDAASGSQRWVFASGRVDSATPLVGPDETVYCAGDSSSSGWQVHAVNGKTGETRWQRPIGGVPIAVGPDGTLYASGNRQLIAIDPARGDVVWSVAVDSADVAVSRDGTVYAAGDRLCALNGATGAIQWERTASEGSTFPEAQTTGFAFPILAPGGVLVVTERVLDPVGPWPRGTHERLVALDAVTGRTLWQAAVPATVRSTPAVAEEGTIYATLGTGVCLAFDGATGLAKWGFPLGPSSSVPIRAGAVNIDANGWVYFTGANTNALFAVDGGANGGLAKTDWPRYRGNARNTGSVVPEKRNRAPVFAAVADQVVTETGLLEVACAATDPDGAADTLTYSLPFALEGMTIDPATGAVRWSPTEAQGPAAYEVNVRVSDDGYPPLSATNRFRVTVLEVNQAPTLSVPPSQTVSPLVAWTAALSASDPDLPANPLTFELLSAPAGLILEPDTGRLAWTPRIDQGGGVCEVAVRVVDNGVPHLSATQAFTLTVEAVDLPPRLTTAVREYTVNAGATLQFTNTAVDPNVPSRPLVFLLDLDAPAGAVLDRVSGVFTWTAPNEAATNRFTLWVTESVAPFARDAGQFTAITLAPAARPRILDLQRTAEGFVTIRWKSVPGARYRLESKPRLDDSSWTPASEVVTAAAEVTGQSTPAPETEGFYRVARVE